MSEPRKIKVVTDEEEAPGIPPNGSADTTPGADAPISRASEGEGQPLDAEKSLNDVQAMLEAREKEHRETYDRLLRVTAEFENYKKRISREMEEFRKFANQSLLKEMLSVVDHIELAIQATGCPPGGESNLVEGLNLTHKEFLRILEKFKVKPIEAVGQSFNPQIHEAIMQEACDRLPDNTVVREMQKGYTINDRLLRPSLVVVAAPRGMQPDSNSNAC